MKENEVIESLTLVQSGKIDSIFNELKVIRSLFETKKKEDQLKEWLPKPEARKKLNVCQKTFDNYLSNGVIPYSRFAGKIYVKASDIEAHLERHYVKA